MSEENKALVRRFFEGTNERNEDVIDEVFAPDYVHHVPVFGDVHGPSGMKDLVYSGLLPAFPDWKYSIEAMVAEGDYVVTRLTATCTHEGEFAGVPPSGNRITMAAMWMSRIADGKIAEDWVNMDALGLMQQMGAMPS